MNIREITEKQRRFFHSEKTIDIGFRKEMLIRLRKAVIEYEPQIAEALAADLGKTEAEGYMCETGLALEELSYMISHVKKLAAPKRKKTPLVNFHGRSFVVNEPYGCVLIMSPWNYPFLLCIQPLAGAIAAGNCAVLKPSAYSPHTSAVIKKIMNETFDEEYVAVIEGGREENRALLEERFDYIFFTGGANVGRQVMEKASRYLTPVTLELGGKSPCIVDKACNVKRAARRIAFGKFLNCGQTCVAPDYLLIHKDIKEAFMKELFKQITAMYSDDPISAPGYGKIINEKHFDRIMGLIDRKKVVFGGQAEKAKLKIAPTVMAGVTRQDAIMQEEIFGPVLPVITVNDMTEAESFIKVREKPLALYIFTDDTAVAKRFVEHVSFGGGCINDTIMHLSNPNLPFGGVGESGMGSYHGVKSFEAFSHAKSILKTYNWLDMPLRYQPYTEKTTGLIKRFLK